MQCRNNKSADNTLVSNAVALISIDKRCCNIETANNMLYLNVGLFPLISNVVKLRFAAL